jgi:anti-repressor protein
MSNIKLFENPEFGKVRVVEVNNEPYFVGVDVAEILGYKIPSKAIKDHCDEDNYKVLTYKAFSEMEIASLWSGNDYSNKVIINEFGVYELILGSELPSAKSFRKWVTSEVLPSIRKNGAYMTEQTLERALAEPDFLIQLATQLKEERNKRLLAEQKATEAQNIMIENQPKISFANAILSSQTSILIGELAKILTQNGYKIGERRLFQWMRDNHYLGSKGERYNIPNQEYFEMELFEIKESVHSVNGTMMITRTPKVTPKGQQYFINKLCKLKQIIF